MRQSTSLLNVEFPPGQCLAYVESLTDEDEKNLAYAEYCYYSGKPEETIRITENYINHENPYLRTTACLVYTFANLSCGHIHMAKFSLDVLQQFYSRIDAMVKIPPDPFPKSMDQPSARPFLPCKALFPSRAETIPCPPWRWMASTS